jgi:DNA-binding XRE family transcriptional regulator
MAGAKKLRARGGGAGGPPKPRSATSVAVPSRGTKPRSFEEWSALRRWHQLPPWEPLRPGYLLRAARESAGLTQVELASRLGVSQQAVAQAERPNANPTVGLLAAWSRALGVGLRIELEGPRR